MAVQLEVKEVDVSRVNGHGFQTRDGEWVNLSKFADPAACPLPVAGQRVRVSLDSKGFARRVEVVDRLPTATALPVQAPSAGATASDAPTAPASREAVITRLAVLNTAAAILCSAGQRVATADVLSVAGQLEAWATR